MLFAEVQCAWLQANQAGAGPQGKAASAADPALEGGCHHLQQVTDPQCVVLQWLYLAGRIAHCTG